MNQTNFSPFKNFKYDIPASIVVFLVGLATVFGNRIGQWRAPLFRNYSRYCWWYCCSRTQWLITGC